MSNSTRLLFSIGLVAHIGNIIFSVIDSNWFAFAGWGVALCYFPFENLKCSSKKKENKKWTKK